MRRLANFQLLYFSPGRRTRRQPWGESSGALGDCARPGAGDRAMVVAGKTTTGFGASDRIERGQAELGELRDQLGRFDERSDLAVQNRGDTRSLEGSGDAATRSPRFGEHDRSGRDHQLAQRM